MWVNKKKKRGNLKIKKRNDQILDLSEENPEPDTFTILGSTETDPLHGRISNESPLAKALMTHKIGDVVTVGVAKPYDVEIVDIKY